MKKAISILLILIFIGGLVLTGCGKSVDTQKEEAPTEPVAEEEPMQVALVLSGGLGDRSFYDSSHEGFEQAKKELGVEGSVLECKNDPSLFQDQLVQASENAQVVVVVGFEFYDVIQEVAPEYPEVNYIYLDNVVEGIDNITSITYLENEGTFLAGALAAMLTQETSIEGINEEKIIGMVDDDDKLQGIWMVGRDVSELVGTLGILLKQKVNIDLIINSLFVHPSLSEALLDALLKFK
jgi:basic membrane protein A